MQLWLNTTVNQFERRSIYRPSELFGLGRNPFDDVKLQQQRASEVREKIRESAEKFLAAGASLAEDLGSAGLDIPDFAPLSNNARMREVRDIYGF